MTAPDLLRALDPCAAVPLPLDTDAGLPGFGDPWHAQAFGTAMALSKAGVFGWAEWVETFSAEIRAHPQAPTETSEAAYYRQWLAALETIVARSGALEPAEVAETAEHWRRSYLNTPHGKPIELSRAWPGSAPSDAHDHDDHDHDHDDHDDHDHHHHHHGAVRPQSLPIAVDRARIAV